jgi:hypothetical protein
MVDIEKFNDVYTQLLNDIKSTFTFTVSVIDDYEDTDETENTNYLFMFIKNSILVLEHISLGQSTELINNNYYLTDGIKFKEIWDDINCNKDTKEQFWKYFHSLLYLICNDDLEKYIEDKFKEHKKYDLMIENSKKFSDYLDNIKKFKSSETDGMNLEDSSIGNLAKEIMGEMGLDENSNKEPSMADLGKMMSTTFNTINNKMQSGEFDQNKMMQEAQQMMGGMNLFGQNSGMPKGPQGMPKAAQGMPKDMNVNRRKMIRKKKRLDKSSDKTPSDKTPSNKTPSDKTPSNKTPSDKTPSDKTPSDKTSSDKTSSDKTSSE